MRWDLDLDLPTCGGRGTGATTIKSSWSSGWRTGLGASQQEQKEGKELYFDATLGFTREQPHKNRANLVDKGVCERVFRSVKLLCMLL